MSKIKEMLDSRYQRQQRRLAALVTACPVDANGHGLGYVLATVAGQAGVRVLTAGPNQTYYPGANLLVEQRGNDAAAAYVVAGWGGGPLPDSGSMEFSGDTSIGGNDYGAGDLVWGNPLTGHFWFDYSAEMLYLMAGSAETGRLDPNKGVFQAGPPAGVHAEYGPTGIEFRDGDTLLSGWDAVGRTIYGVEIMGRPHGPGIEMREYLDETNETRYKWQILGVNGVPGVAFVTGNETDPDDYKFFIGPLGADERLIYEDGALTLTGAIHATGGTIDGTLTIADGGQIVNQDVTLNSTLLQITAPAGNTSFELAPRGVKWITEAGVGIGQLTAFEATIGGNDYNIQKLRVSTNDPDVSARQYFQAVGTESCIYHQVFAQTADSNGVISIATFPYAYTELRSDENNMVWQVETAYLDVMKIYRSATGVSQETTIQGASPCSIKMAAPNSGTTYIEIDPGSSNDLYLSRNVYIGRASGSKVSHFDVTPVAQQAHIADATGAADAITRINAILLALENYGLLATS